MGSFKLRPSRVAELGTPPPQPTYLEENNMDVGQAFFSQLQKEDSEMRVPAVPAPVSKVNSLLVNSKDEETTHNDLGLEPSLMKSATDYDAFKPKKLRPKIDIRLPHRRMKSLKSINSGMSCNQ